MLVGNKRKYICWCGIEYWNLIIADDYNLPITCLCFQVLWRKDSKRMKAENDKRITVNGDKLTIDDVKKSDEGKYECVAKNILGRRTSKSGKLTVKSRSQKNANSLCIVFVFIVVILILLISYLFIYSKTMCFFFSYSTPNNDIYSIWWIM